MPEYDAWMAVGFLGQTLFTGRFIVQWLASERKGDSVVPVAFWWLSLLGGSVLLTYAIAKRDPVFVTGQGIGLCVYARNLMLLRGTNRATHLAERAEAHRPVGSTRAAMTSAR